ncbi:MAG TPA: hypothetical protein VG675_20690 [Bryobacteraceae bacterium]|nr:hypothetical protein [Bryobacteraceae bacterium]
MLDLRIPSGFFFSLLGLILLAMRIFAPGTHAALSGTDVNLYCGIFMLAFGVFLLWLSRRAARGRR